MKIKESTLFPHPVLRKDNEDYKSSKFETKLSDKNLISDYLIKLDLSLDNKEMLELIKKEQAKIICHMECSKTKFRNIKELTLGENEFMIQAGEIEGAVIILPLIVANKEINNYYSKDFNKDYENNSFKVKKGDILAIGKHFQVTIKNKRDKLSSIPSIFSIVPHNPNQKETIVILSEDKIKIYIPENSFKIYNKYRKNEWYNNIMCSIIILPSLIYTLDALKEGDLIEYGDKRWFRRITNKLKEIGINIERGELIEKDILKLAQSILENLNSKSIDSLIKLEKTEENEK